MAPLPVGLTLGAWRPLHLVAAVAHEAHHVVEVEAVAHCAAVDGAPRVSAADGCRVGEGKKKRTGDGSDGPVGGSVEVGREIGGVRTVGFRK